MALPRLHRQTTTTSLNRETMKERPPEKDSSKKSRPSPARNPPYVSRRRGAISGPSGQAALTLARSRLESTHNNQPVSESAIDSDNPSSTDSGSPQSSAPRETQRPSRQFNIPIRSARQARPPRLRAHPLSDSTSSPRLNREGNEESPSARRPSAGDPSTRHESRNNENEFLQTRRGRYSRSPEKEEKEQRPEFKGKRQ